MTAKNNKTVIVGMSGGVDSSVAAALLKEEGYKVIGLFMKNWEENDEFGNCMASYEYEDVIRVCDSLDIPYYSVEFIKEYQDNVFREFVEGYQKGHTPNPDVLCNREIKFKAFYNKAKEFGADYIATGHYCQTDAQARLIKGLDTGKDQSYFLYMVNSEVLKEVLFPIGHLEKKAVREIARKYNLSTKDKKDSTGICFIGERNFKNFLSSYLKPQAGPFQNLNGNLVGEHSGAAFYTIGQRKGLGLGGPGEPWFVVAKDIDKNIVFVERGLEHPALFTDELYLKEITWIKESYEAKFPVKLSGKVRYRQADQCLEVFPQDDGLYRVRFDIPQRAVTLGQSLVLYDGDICLGGGIIEKIGKTYFEMNKDLPKIVSR